MEECTNQKLLFFSLEHYTYINQIFGDQAFRQIINETFPNKSLTMEVENAYEEFEFSHHHFIMEKKTGKRICSVDDRYQDQNVNVNDTLCQSYSLLTYFGIPINPDQKQRQMDMIDMYRKILSSKKFVKNLDDIIHNENGNDKLWIDYTKVEEEYVVMNKRVILQKIYDVLDKWQRYGFYYFIGKGKCPRVAKPPPVIVPRPPSQRIAASAAVALGGRTKRKITKKKKSRSKY